MVRFEHYASSEQRALPRSVGYWYFDSFGPSVGWLIESV